MNRQPQLIAQQRLRFLDPVHALRTNDEAGVHIWVVRECAAVVAGETDGVQAALARLGQRGEQVGRIAAGRHGDGDVAGLGAGDQLTREHQLEPDVVAQRGHDRLIGGQRPRGQDGLPIGGRANSRAKVVESVQLPPFPKVNIRPPAANRRAISVAAASSRSALASSVERRSARLSAAFACADAARSASSDLGSSSCASMNGYRKLVVSLSCAHDAHPSLLIALSC